MEQACENLPLCEVPTDIVMGHGNLHAEVMFIGEAPGKNEAEQRKPFVGRAGKLLNATLEQAGMRREDMYISNIVKVRPPNNRDPESDEIQAFMPYLRREIELIQPQLFVSLGRFALNFFLPDARISAVHGVLQRFWWEDRVTYLLPLYHPAAALRNGNFRESFEQDTAKIPKALEYITNKQDEDSKMSEIQEALL